MLKYLFVSATLINVSKMSKKTRCEGQPELI